MKGYVTFIFIQLQLELLIVSCISVYGFFAFKRSEKVSEQQKRPPLNNFNYDLEKKQISCN